MAGCVDDPAVTLGELDRPVEVGAALDAWVPGRET